MKTADEYAELAEINLDLANAPSDSLANYHLQRAVVYQGLAQTAATLEAAGPPWPEAAKAMEDQYAPYYCSREWVDKEATIPGDVNALPGEPNQHDGKPHRCIYAAGHEKEEPHYCRCGAEL